MSNTEIDDMKPEYYLTKLRVRKMGEGRLQMVILDKDVREVFQDSESVNEALRFLIRVTKQHQAELQK